jgi:hypothetical protein
MWSKRDTLAKKSSDGRLGVAALDAAVYAPTPTAFTAATRNTYAVPVVNPVTVALVAVDAAAVHVVHVVPLSLLNCSR